MTEIAEKILGAADAAHLVRTVLHERVHSVQRLTTDLCHYVYEVVTQDDRSVVVRIATADIQKMLAGGIYWNPRLRELGLPLPEMFASDADGRPFPFMILER